MLNLRPHAAQNANRLRSALDGRTARHPGDTASSRIRRRIEDAVSCTKSVAAMRRTKLRGRDKVDRAFAVTAAACSLLRLPKPLAVSA